MADELSKQERQAVRRAFDRVSEQGWGLGLGVLGSVGLFAATAVLLLRAGPNTGQHLSLLSVYLPGYSVTWTGAFVGAAYAFFLGYGAGRTIATIYNRLVRRR